MSKIEFEQHKSVDGFPVIEFRLDSGVSGEHARQIEDKIIYFFYEQGVKCFIINFVNVRYTGSTGMGLLVKVADKLNESGGKVKLSYVPEKVIALFDMLGLVDLFDFCETTEDALQKPFYE